MISLSLSQSLCLSLSLSYTHIHTHMYTFKKSPPPSLSHSLMHTHINTTYHLSISIFTLVDFITVNHVTHKLRMSVQTKEWILHDKHLINAFYSKKNYASSKSIFTLVTV